MTVAEPDRCPCGGTYQSRRVEVRMTVHNEQVVLPEVTQDACPLCGLRTYRAAVLEALEAVLRGRGDSAVRLRV